MDIGSGEHSESVSYLARQPKSRQFVQKSLSVLQIGLRAPTYILKERPQQAVPRHAGGDAIWIGVDFWTACCDSSAALVCFSPG